MLAAEWITHKDRTIFRKEGNPGWIGVVRIVTKNKYR